MLPRLRPPARIWLILVTLGLTAAVSGSAAWLCLQAKSQILADEERELRSLSTVLADQSERAFQAVETVQGSLVETIAGPALIETPEKLDAFLRSKQMHETLADKINGLSHVEALSLVDDHGALLNISRFWPTPAIDVSDRDYFQAATGVTRRKTSISRPVRSRVSGLLNILVTRRIDLGERGFRGLVLCAIDPAYFERLYASLSLGPGSAIALYRDDGTLLARYPAAETATEAPPLPSALFKDTDARGGSSYVRRKSQVDGKDRFTSLRAISTYGLVVVVSSTVEGVLAPWRAYTRDVVLAALLVNLLIGLAAALVYRQRSMYAKACFDARHDALTGLANRACLQDGLARRAEACGGAFALVLLDLDHFKNVNDCAGHAAGDLLLKAVAAALVCALDEGDSVARLSGDEFALLLAATPDVVRVGAKLERVYATLREPAVLGQFAAAASASMGVAFYPTHARDASELMRKADLALYTAKADGRACWRLYEPAMDAAMQAQQAIEAGLRLALRRGELELYLQPVVDIEALRPVGFEALVRWNHPVRGLVSPGEFIPVAEKSGLIVPLGNWVLRAACEAAAHWHDGLTVSVNVSAVQLLDGRLVETVSDALAASGLAAGRLELEITETVFLEQSGPVGATLRGLQRLGVKIALDDFGTGFSSLRCLVGFPFDRVKIDQSFVRGMEASAKHRAIVRMVIGLARDTGIAVTAEGVETRVQLDQLRAEGCMQVQGFYFSKPKPVAEALAFSCAPHPLASAA